MNSLQHIPEEELIAYQLEESGDAAGVRAHLEGCAECAALSASIAETLRVFSAGPVPEPNLEHQWQRLRGNLSVLSPAPRRGLRLLLWPAAGLALAACALLAVMAVRPKPRQVYVGGQAIRQHGPLTNAPTGPTGPVDPLIANHLDNAERLLTEVNHASGPLDEQTRAEARNLLVKNAVYVRTAHERGDLGEASVLENLGRVLTNIDHEPTAGQGGWHVRFELNTDGLLLDIRILQQNNDDRL